MPTKDTQKWNSKKSSSNPQEGRKNKIENNSDRKQKNKMADITPNILITT